VGSAECVRLVPEAFRLDESRGVSAPLPAAAWTERDKLGEAAAACPMGAISVREGDTA